MAANGLDVGQLVEDMGRRKVLTEELIRRLEAFSCEHLIKKHEDHPEMFQAIILYERIRLLKWIIKIKKFSPDTSFIRGGSAACQHEVNSGETLLHFATRFGCLSSVDCLLKLNANIMRVDHNGRTPLGVLMIQERMLISSQTRLKNAPKILNLLIEYGANIKRAPHNQPYLHMAIRHRHKPYEIVELLLRKHADPDELDDRGLTPMQAVVLSDDIPECEKLQILEIFIKHGAKLTTRSSRGKNLLDVVPPNSPKILAFLNSLGPVVPTSPSATATSVQLFPVLPLGSTSINNDVVISYFRNLRKSIFVRLNDFETTQLQGASNPQKISNDIENLRNKFMTDVNSVINAIQSTDVVEPPSSRETENYYKTIKYVSMVLGQKWKFFVRTLYSKYAPPNTTEAFIQALEAREGNTGGILEMAYQALHQWRIQYGGTVMIILECLEQEKMNSTIEYIRNQRWDDNETEV